MLRLVYATIVVLAVIALISRSPKLRRALHVALGVLALYAVLKLTGVIETIAPARDGVF